MELQIQNLVSSIRKEGIEAANKEAESIIAEAKKKAESIVAEAKTQADQYRESSEKEISILRESAQISAEQAKRDAALAFKEEIRNEFEKILAADVRKELSGEGLGKLIRAALSGENLAAYTAEVAEVGDMLKAELAQEIKGGLEIRPSRDVQQGFRLSAKDGSGYFDCSDDGILEMLMPYFRDLDFQ
ncbi:MAG: hypothetical protein IJG52_04625 [Lachnospiraceae bacterium]|nr:hypothetical protein [Lachnospiraceae bacterium]